MSKTTTEESSVDDHVTDADRPTRTEEAYKKLKRQILSVELEPGRQLREADATATLGLGKTPVREALLRLSFEGLVRLQSRSGYTVAPLTLKNARDICDLRALLEGQAAYLAASVGRWAADELRTVEERGTASHRHGQAAGTDALAAWVERERAFHLALGRVAGNDLLRATLSNVFDNFERLCHLAAALGQETAFGWSEHTALIAAISSGSANEARELAVAEITQAQVRVIQALLASESLATTNVAPVPGRHAFYLDVPASENTGGHE